MSSTEHQHSDSIDILSLIHDIHIAHRNKSRFSQYLDEIKSADSRLQFDSHVELNNFLKQTVYKRKQKYAMNISESKHNDEDIWRLVRQPEDTANTPINWLCVFYNKHFTDISQRLSIISPLLALYQKDAHLAVDPAAVQRFHAVQLIRTCIPRSSPVRGHLDIEQLFGQFEQLNTNHVSSDLCRNIVSYLDLPTFFKCSLINHNWLHLIYRNDSFAYILKQCTNDNPLKCVMVDHSSLNHLESGFLSNMYINWQLRSNSVYLDFMTLEKSWILQYIDAKHIRLTLQRYMKSTPLSHGNVNIHSAAAADDEKNEQPPLEQVCTWHNLKSVQTNTCKLFDSMDVLDLRDVLASKEKPCDDEQCLYRLRIEISRPFPLTLYTEASELRPFAWYERYHAHPMDIESEQKFWFEYYLDLLYSMIDLDVSQALGTILEAAQRMKFDSEYVREKLMDRELMQQIVRLVQHKDCRIQHNAGIFLGNVFASNSFKIRDEYLTLCTFGTDYNVVDVTFRAIHKLLSKSRCENHEAVYPVLRALLCVVGNYVISKSRTTNHEGDEDEDKNADNDENEDEEDDDDNGDKDENKMMKDTDKWKLIALQHPLNFVSFMTNCLNQETKLISRENSAQTAVSGVLWSFRSMAIWSVSNFYRYRSKHEKVNEILNANVCRQLLHLFLDFTVVVGELYTCNAREMNNKMSKLLNKVSKTKETYEKEQRCYNTVLLEACIGIQRIFSNKYYTLSEVLDISIARKIAESVLDVCIAGIDADWAQYLTHLCLRIVSQTLRYHGGFAQQYIDLKLSHRLHSVLQIIKKVLPNESGFVSSVRHWIKTKTTSRRNAILPPTSTDDRREIQKINSFIELYDDVVDITNSVAKHSEFFNLADLMLDILCLYAQRESCEEQYMQHTVAYLWHSLSEHPAYFRKVTLKHKGFNKLLLEWSAHSAKHGVVFNGIVSNLRSVLNDNNLFQQTFSKRRLVLSENEEQKSSSPENEYFCPCGLKLENKEAQHCYDNSLWLYCDACFSKLSGDTMVYHCDKREPQHKNGFDLCVNCATQIALIKSSDNNNKK